MMTRRSQKLCTLNFAKMQYSDVSKVYDLKIKFVLCLKIRENSGFFFNS